MSRDFKCYTDHALDDGFYFGGYVHLRVPFDGLMYVNKDFSYDWVAVRLLGDVHIPSRIYNSQYFPESRMLIIGLSYVDPETSKLYVIKEYNEIEFKDITDRLELAYNV